MTKQTDNTDLVFSALADRNRRKIVEMLFEKESSILDLSGSFSMSFQALSKHIKLLETAGIVNKERKGKFAICSLDHQALKDSLKWISYHSNFWNGSFDKLDSLIKKNESRK